MMKFILIYFLFFFNLLAEMKFDSLYKFEKNFTYALVLPKNFNPEKKYYLALGLHGLFGDGSKLLNPFAYYTKYSNMILVCPDGNISDPERKSVKWGYERSEDYILELLTHLKTKYNLEKEIFFFGFSQGANQGLNTALSKPKIFSYFVALSGGYTVLNEKQFSNSKKTNLYFLTGDTGDGEIYTKNEVDKRILELSKFTDQLERKIYLGLRHELSFEEAFDSIAWFYQKIEKKNPIKEDYFPFYVNAKENFLKGRFKEAEVDSEKILKLVPNFSPAKFLIAKSNFYSNDFGAFKKSFFETLISYSQNLYFDEMELIEFIDLVKKTDLDFLKSIKLIPFLVNLTKEEKIHSKFKAELHLFLGDFYYANKEYKLAKTYFQIAEEEFINLKVKSNLVEGKLIYISEFLKELKAN